MKKITLLFAVIAFSMQSYAQFTESFDTEIPATWTITDVDGGNTWVHNTLDNHAGAGHARITYNATAHDDYLITPQFTVTTGTSDRISFWSAISSNWAETFEVRLSTTGLAAADFTVVLGSEAPTTNAPSYTQYIYDLAAYDGMSVYIAIRATATDKFYLHIDEFVNDTMPSCPEPLGLAAAPTSITDVDISWTAGGSETAWNYEYGTAGFVIGTGTSGSTAVPNLSLTGLATGDYDVYVDADCGGGDFSFWTETSWTQPSNVGDICSLPIAATLEANCATATPNTIDYAVAAADLSAVSCAVAGSNGAWFELTTSASGAIQTTTTGDVTGMAVFSDCGTELYCNPTLVPVFSLTGFAPNTTYFLVLWKDAATTGTSDVCFEDITCNFVTDFTSANITETSADIGWTENGTATTWDIEYGVTGFTPTEIPTINDTTTNPHMVTGLTAGTTYDFYIRADCGMDDTDVSLFNGPYTITTSALPATNDECTDAIDLDPSMNADGTCTISYTGSNVGATNSAGEVAPSATCTNGDLDPNPADIWFTLTVPATGGFIYDDIITPGISSLVEVYTGTCGALTAITPVNCTNATAEKTFEGLTPGTTVYLRYWDYGSDDEGAFEFCIKEIAACPDPTGLTVSNLTETSADLGWTQTGSITAWNIEYGALGFALGTGTMITGTTTNPYALSGLTNMTDYEFYVQADCSTNLVGPFAFTTLGPPPANDDISGAIVLTIDAGYCDGINNNGDNSFATDSLEANGSCFNGTAPTDDVWFSFTVPANIVTVDISTDYTGGTLVDSEIALYSGTSGNLTEISCSQDEGVTILSNNSSWNSLITDVAVTVGETYYVQVSGYGSGTNQGSFCLEISTNQLSIDDYSKPNAFSYYPNPVKDNLQLKAQKDIQNVSIYNMLGQEVQHTAPNAVNTEVNMSSLQAGAYFVKVTIDNATETVRIIKN